MKMGEENKERLESEQMAIVGVHNNTLVCRDCLLRFDDSEIYGNVSRCEAYPVHKPQDVMFGGPCDEYIKE